MGKFKSLRDRCSELVYFKNVESWIKEFARLNRCEWIINKGKLKEFCDEKMIYGNWRRIFIADYWEYCARILMWNIAGKEVGNRWSEKISWSLVSTQGKVKGDVFVMVLVERPKRFRFYFSLRLGSNGYDGKIYFQNPGIEIPTEESSVETYPSLNWEEEVNYFAMEIFLSYLSCPERVEDLERAPLIEYFQNYFELRHFLYDVANKIPSKI